MAKQQTEIIADDLMADSLQAENYLKQGRTCSLATIQLGLEDWLHLFVKPLTLLFNEGQAIDYPKKKIAKK